jgi:L-lactate dehydrogenase (cytochrome)
MRELVSVEDARARARRSVPGMIFDFIDGAAENEVTARQNRSAFEEITFRPAYMSGTEQRSQRTTVLGASIESPVLVAPTGSARLVHRDGEVGIARAAHRAGTIPVLSVMSSYSMEEVSAAAERVFWLQIFAGRQRWVTEALVERAAAAGAKALCVTIDTPVPGRHDRDLYSGIRVPPRIRLRTVTGAMMRPGWVLNFMRKPWLTYGNLRGLQPDMPTRMLDLGRFAFEQLVQPTATWAEIDFIRDRWNGPLVIKGVVSAELAKQAVEHGANALIVSNHGGRQLDGLPATIELLPEVVDVVGGQAEVLLDSGIRRGGDVVKAVALGARACLVGRAPLYGLAYRGEQGVEAVLRQFRIEIDSVLALLGQPDIHDVDAAVLRPNRWRP